MRWWRKLRDAVSVTTPANFADERLKVGAYITNGAGLYEVVGLIKVAGPMVATTFKVKVENCRNLAEILLEPQKIFADFELVKRAPEPAVPDEVGQITWEAA